VPGLAPARCHTVRVELGCDGPVAGPGLAKLDDPSDHPLFVLALGSVALTASVRDPEIGDEPHV
jgi:hypothetical protein